MLYEQLDKVHTLGAISHCLLTFIDDRSGSHKEGGMKIGGEMHMEKRRTRGGNENGRAKDSRSFI